MTTQERESDYSHFDLEVSIKRHHSLVFLGLWRVVGPLRESNTRCSPHPWSYPHTNSSAQQTGCQSAVTGQTLACQTSRTPGILEAMTTWEPLQTIRRQSWKGKMVCNLRMHSPWDSKTGPAPIWEGTEMVRAKDTLSLSPCRNHDYH